MRVAEAGGRVEPFETQHGAEAVLNRSVSLFKQVIGIPRRAMGHGRPELEPNRAGVGAVAIGVTRMGLRVVIRRAVRKKARAAGRSRVSLRRTSSKFPS